MPCYENLTGLNRYLNLPFKIFSIIGTDSPNFLFSKLILKAFLSAVWLPESKLIIDFKITENSGCSFRSTTMPGALPSIPRSSVATPIATVCWTPTRPGSMRRPCWSQRIRPTRPLSPAPRPMRLATICLTSPMSPTTTMRWSRWSRRAFRS